MSFFQDIDNMDSIFSQYKSECQGCDMFLPVNDLGLLKIAQANLTVT